VRLQDTRAIIQSSERKCIEAKKYIFLLKIYKVIANETSDDEIRELYRRRRRRNRSARNIARNFVVVVVV